MSDLPRIIATVETRLAVAERTCGSYRDDPDGWHSRHRAAMDGVAASLAADLRARINDRWDGCRVRIAGITSSSTTGTAGALRNWIAAARKRLKADAS